MLALAERGYDVAVNDLGHEDEARRRVEEVESLGRRAVFIAADVRTREANDLLVAETVRRLGGLDVFCANAGVARWQELTEVTRDDWRFVVGVNLHGVVHGCSAAAAQMRRRGKGGRIVITSSVNAVMPFTPLGVYGATKHAVALLAGVMAREWAEDGIAVNHVGPGWVDSSINDPSPDFATPERREAARASIPFGHRPAEPREIGEAVAHLVESTYTTGAFLRVDGGLVIGKY